MTNFSSRTIGRRTHQHPMRPISEAGLTEREIAQTRNAPKGNILNREQLQLMFARTRASTTVFARCMGVARGTLAQYLRGARPTPAVALAAANYALISLGYPIEISGERIRENLGIKPPPWP
jgi:transcriptional regulator with XRE-family HTH domain